MSKLARATGKTSHLRMSELSTYTGRSSCPAARARSLRDLWYGAAARKVASTAKRLTAPSAHSQHHLVLHAEPFPASFQHLATQCAMPTPFLACSQPSLVEARAASQKVLVQAA